ncbi:hypothetical protein JCM14076_28020 [Methylosoma difficile]
MPAIQQLEKLALPNAHASRLKQLIGILKTNPTPNLAQIFQILYPEADESKAKNDFRQLLFAINNALKAHNSPLAISTGNKHKPISERQFSLLSTAEELDKELEEFHENTERFSVAASYATSQILDVIPQRALMLLKCFVSYAHVDAEDDNKTAESFFTLLQQHLKPIQNVQCTIWRDDGLSLGKNYITQINQALDESHCGILLFSPGFFGSDFIRDHELPKLLKKAYLAPLLLKPILPKKHIPANLEKLQYFHQNNQAFSELDSVGKAAFVLQFVDKFIDEAMQQISAPTNETSLSSPKKKTKSKLKPTKTCEDICLPEDLVQELLDTPHRPNFDVANFDPHLREKILAEWRAQTGLLGEAAPSEADNSVIALDNLMAWFQDPSKTAYATVLAEYGMGKTTLCQKLVLDNQHRRAAGEDVPPIIYFDLRNLRERATLATDTIETIINELIRRNFQDVSNQDTFTAQQVLQAVREDHALVIFDGLDEVLTTVDSRTGDEFLRTIWNALPPNHVAERRKRQLPVGKLLLTCRSHYFRTVTKEANFYTGQGRDGFRAQDYHVLWLLPLTDEQIDQYIEQNFATQSQRIKDVIKQVHNLGDLAKRPLNLRYITELWPRLEQRKTQQGKALLASDFYYELLEQVLERDVAKAQFSHAHKRELLEALAAELHRRGIRSWAVDELEDWAKDYIHNNPRWLRDYGLSHAKPKDIQQRLEELIEDLRTAMLIVREGEQNFRFAHTSIQEYALAAYLYRALKQGDAAAWMMPLPTVETLDFLGELLQGEQQALALATLSTLSQRYQAQASELLFDYAIRAHRSGYPCISLRGCQLQGAKLDHLHIPEAATAFDISQADFTSADLKHSTWFGLRADGAIFNYSDLSFSEWHNSSACNAQFQRADLVSSVFRNTDFSEADFGFSNAKKAEWRRCQMTGVAFNNIGGDFDSVACRVQGQLQEAKPQSLAKLVTNVDLIDTRLVNDCAWSPNDTVLASASDDHTVNLWDTTSGRLRISLVCHGEEVRQCAWSPDGKILASVSSHNTVKLWDAASGGLRATLVGHQSRVSRCAWSPDGTVLASASGDGTVKLWDATSGSLRATLADHKARITYCAWSPNGTMLASAGSNGKIKLWDATNGSLHAPLAGHDRWVSHCAWSPNGRVLASASVDGSIKLWDAASGGLRVTLGGHKAGFTYCAWSPNGRVLASASGDRTVKLWDAANGGLRNTLAGHKGGVSHCAWSPDGRVLASSSVDGTVKLWDAANGGLRNTLAGHEGWVRLCEWSPDDKTIVSAGNDGVRLWRATDGKALRAFYHLPAKFSPQAQYLSLANTNLDSDNPEINWEVVDYSDEAWRYVFYQGQDAQGRLRRWPWEPV